MSIDGKWTVTVQSPMGAQKSDIDFKADGGTLTGTASGQGGTQQIADGKIDGANISWKVSITTPFPMTLEFAGTYADATMSGNVKAGSFGSFPFSGVRS
ncbi:MAG TPA: hypothetical protein VGG48_00345 [Rhizomicrobium sp.]|jgi:hypothetical protein